MMAEIRREIYRSTAIEHRPMRLEWLAGRGVRLELPGSNDTMTIELSFDECEAIADAIGRTGVDMYTRPSQKNNC